MNPRIMPRSARQPSPARRAAFTLVELLVVIAIIGMLMALLVPAVQMAREAGRRASCMNNQRELGTAVINYVTAKDKFPPSFSVQPNPNSITGLPQFVGWVPPMLPYVEQNPLYQVFQNPTSGNNWSTQQGATIAVLVCPSRNATTPAPLCYIVNCGAPDADSTAAGYPSSPTPPIDNQENGIFFDQYSTDVYNASHASKMPRVTVDQTYLNRHDGSQFTLMLTESTDALDWILTGKASDLPPPAPPATGPGARSWWQGCTWDLPIGSPGPTPPFASTNTSGTVDQSTGANNKLILNRNTGLGVTYATASSLATNAGLPNEELAFARPASNHPGGFLATFCGGNAQFVSQDIDYRVYYLIMTPDSYNTKVPGKSPATNVTLPTPWTTSQSQVTPDDLNK